MKFRIGTVLAICGIIYFINTNLAEAKMQFTIKSTAFENGEEIPVKYTYQGEDISPPLQWEGIPAKTKSLALIVDDPDAPDPKAPKMTWVHWVLYNIPESVTNLSEGANPQIVNSEIKAGLNDWSKAQYGGPAPPIGQHRYFFKLYALDIMLKGLNHPTKAKVEATIKGHILAETELMGTYEKTK